MNYKQLLLFRQQVYDLLNFAKDATFELTDAVLTTRNAYSLAEFSLSPCFQGATKALKGLLYKV
jgi:hypothetical protein